MCVGCEDELFAAGSLNHSRARASSLIIFHTDPTYLCLLLYNGVKGHLTTLNLTAWGPRVSLNMLTNQSECFFGCQETIRFSIPWLGFYVLRLCTDILTNIFFFLISIFSEIFLIICY